MMNILYVDDEVDLLELATSFFEDEHLTLDTSADFTEALNLIGKKRYDVIIADVRMPSGSGIELIQKAREEKNFQGICILASGDVGQNEAKASGCTMVVNKPIHFPKLIDLIKDLFQNK